MVQRPERDLIVVGLTGKTTKFTAGLLQFGQAWVFANFATGKHLCINIKKREIEMCASVNVRSRLFRKFPKDVSIMPQPKTHIEIVLVHAYVDRFNIQ